MFAPGKLIADPDSGIRYYNNVLSLSQDTKFQEGVITALNQLGNFNQRKGNYIQSFSYYHKGIAYISSFPRFRHYLALLYNNIGNGYSAMGSYDSAITSYYKAIESQDHFGSFISLVTPFINLGNTLNKLDRPQQALSIFKKAVDICSTEENKLYIATVYQNIGAAYLQLKIKDSLALAEKYSNLALQLAREQKFGNIEYSATAVLGSIHAAKEDHAGAVAYFEAAMKISPGRLYDAIALQANMASSYYELKQYARSQALLEKAMEEAKNAAPDLLPAIYFNLARAYRAQGAFKKASDFYDQYFVLNEELKGDHIKDKISTLQLQYETSLRDNAIIKKELEITRQRATIQRKNTIIFISLTGAMFLIGGFILYFRKRQLIQRQRSEIATWKAAQDGEERERTRIAKDLHDNIGGILSTVKMWFETIGQRRHGLQDDKDNNDYSEAMGLLQTALTEVRNTAHHLMPSLLLNLGLTEAVRIFCENIEKASGIEIQFQYYGSTGKLDDSLDLVIYRTVQELVQNAVRHGKALFILVQLSRDENHITLTVEDNGNGMDTTAASTTNGMGLQSLKQSIERLKGQFELQSIPGNGTVVNIDIDMQSAFFKKLIL